MLLQRSFPGIFASIINLVFEFHEFHKGKSLFGIVILTAFEMLTAHLLLKKISSDRFPAHCDFVLEPRNRITLINVMTILVYLFSGIFQEVRASKLIVRESAEKVHI
jgi:hypothetical protein